MKSKKVLITGGNGHVGNSLAKALCDKGYDVRVTVRNPEAVKESGIFDGYDVDLYQADIRDESALEVAMDGIEGVFQVAALYNYDEQTLDQGIIDNNTLGSQLVLKLAKSINVERVVFTSSIAAVGFEGSKESPLTEDNWGDPADAYCRSKLVSERAAIDYAQEHGLDLVTLCPSIIMGPQFYKHTPSTVNVSAAINNQIPFRFPFQCSIVDVRDIADAHIRAFENKDASGRYLVTGTNVESLFDSLSEVEPDMVVPKRILSLNEAKQLARKTGASEEMVGRPFHYSDNRIKSELGWNPRGVSETLKDTVEWIKERGL
jgi:dihydroflavonol-4-reductase